MSKIFVTGSAGFIGSVAIEMLFNSGHGVFHFTAKTTFDFVLPKFRNIFSIKS